MTKKTKSNQKLLAKLPKGMRDIESEEIYFLNDMLRTIGNIYQRYGFEALDTPAFEYAEALGKFLPDQERPNEGVFSFQDEDDNWLSLRYDLTAPLARYVAENYDQLSKPFRRYQTGYVWRNEKPGPGRFRQFVQFDADTVGAASFSADAELCMMASDCLEELGIKKGDYAIKINNRKLLDAVLKNIGLSEDDENYASRRLTILRAIDKLDRLGIKGVELLLGEGRKDKSGDFTSGADLDKEQQKHILEFISSKSKNRQVTLDRLRRIVGDSKLGKQAIHELEQMDKLFVAANYSSEQIAIDPSVIRGLDYYTGAVFEAELLFKIHDEKGREVRFGSVGGGGRYDELVKRFKGIEVPATGFSIGVSRLYSALQLIGKFKNKRIIPPVIVLVMDKERMTDYQEITSILRQAGIRAEMYLGSSGMRAQMKYADKRNSPLVIIQGEDEKARNEVTIKDLYLGSEIAKEITDNQVWRNNSEAQFSVPITQMIDAVKEILEKI